MAIDHVSDTARWVAYYRAMETERPDAIFSDPYAKQLAGVKGAEIVETLMQGRRMAWAMIVRTAVFDEIIMLSIAERGVDTVLNIAAGLDARPWRLNLPPKLHWVDVDLPDILNYKTETLRGVKAKCEYEAVTADITDEVIRRQLLERVSTLGKNVLVITEGLVIYLTREEVTALATDLARHPNFCWWLTDNTSPRLLRYMKKTWGKAADDGNAPFKFAPEEGTDFYRPLGWREVEFRGTLPEAKRLDREMKGMWFFKLLIRLRPKKTREEFQRLSGFVLLER
ncbi:MAG TPA: class I SAM-dependent methyltransferase [Gemmatimonadaceae bacterium]|nr:class I SAM-dependent methyltransferase [Gemmatimonadaceae bacterium]